MRTLILDVPVGNMESSYMAEYLNDALSKYNASIVEQKLVKDLNVRLPGSKTFTLGLLCLASVLRENNYDVCYKQLDGDYIVENLVEEIDVVMLSCKTTTYLKCLKIAERIKKYKPKIITIFGGPHPTALPHEVLKEDCVDIISLGEGELTTKELFKALRDKKDLVGILGIGYKNDRGEIIINQPRTLCENLNDLPEPAYDLLDGELSEYHLYVESGRGCLHRCSFCANPLLWNCQVRKYSAERVYARLEELSHRLPKNTLIHMVDPAYGFMDEDKKLWDMLIKKPLPLKFSCDMCALNVDGEIIRKMSEAGFCMFCIGIENIDDNVLRINHKPASLNIIKKACETIRNNSNALIKTYWIIGLPGETEESVRENRNCIVSMLNRGDFDICCEHIFVPYPGCAVYENPKKYNYRIYHKDWDLFDAMISTTRRVRDVFYGKCVYCIFRLVKS